MITCDGYHTFSFYSNFSICSFQSFTSGSGASIFMSCPKVKSQPQKVGLFSAHNLRHTFCTRFCENESNLKVIQSVMGHKDISTTMDIYAEATEEKKQEIMASLQGKIFT